MIRLDGGEEVGNFVACIDGQPHDPGTALKSLKREFNGMRWFVEGDIKGCFDNINHDPASFCTPKLVHSEEAFRAEDSSQP